MMAEAAAPELSNEPMAETTGHPTIPINSEVDDEVLTDNAEHSAIPSKTAEQFDHPDASNNSAETIPAQIDVTSSSVIKVQNGNNTEESYNEHTGDQDTTEHPMESPRQKESKEIAAPSETSEIISEQHHAPLSASEIIFDIPLNKLVPYHLDFLKVVYTHQYLKYDAVLRAARRRYENNWLPLLVENRDKDLEPPIDVHWIWHCHMLSPHDYVRDCKSLHGIVPPHQLRPTNSQQYYSAVANAEHIWNQAYPEEPYDLDYGNVVRNEEEKTNGATAVDVKDEEDWKIKYDLISATYRQKTFFYQVSLPHYGDEKFVEAAVGRYKDFLCLKKANPNVFTVPMYDIDLVWHTHQLYPQSYGSITKALFGKMLNHDDKDQARGKGTKLSTGFEETKRAWYKKHRSMYAINGSCNRGVALNDQIQKHSMERPKCLKHVLRITHIKITGCQGSDIISARICDTHEGTLIELPRQKGTENMFAWKPDAQVQLVTSGENRETLVHLYLSKAAGMFGGLVPLAKIALKMSLQGQSSGDCPLLATATTSNMNTTLEYFVDESTPVNQPLYIEWGAFSQEVMPQNPTEAWGPLNIPRELPGDDPPVCGLATHRVTVGGNTLYTIKVYHILVRGLSFVQVYQEEQLLATSEVISSYQLPAKSQVSDPARCVTLDQNLNEKAMLIKNADGDWGIVKGHSTNAGFMTSFFTDMDLVASLTILSPFSTGTFSMKKSPPWKRSASLLTSLFANTSRMTLFGGQGISVNMAEMSIHIGEQCSHVPEFLAAMFSIWVE